jgi:hypothetical protein
MLECSSELTEIVARGGLESIGEPAVKRAPRLVGKTSERSLADQVVGQPE